MSPVLNQAWSATWKAGRLETAIGEFDVAGHHVILVDAALAGMIGQRNLHHLKAPVAKLVRGEERAVGPAERDPGDRRLRLQLRQEDEFALVGLAGVEHVLQEQGADGGVGGAGLIDDGGDLLANRGHDLLVDGASELPAGRLRRAPPQQAGKGGGEQNRGEHQRRDRNADADRHSAIA